MRTAYTNFYYDPLRQGYDSSVWRTIFGLPTVTGNQLSLANASVVHYGDILKGDVTFSVNMPTAPSSGNSRKVGLYQINRGAYLWFSISGTVITAEAADGLGNTSSSTLTWESGWTGANVEFRIKWIGGNATFYIDNRFMAAINDIAVPGRPLSLYMSNGNSDAMTIKYIEAVGIQSWFLNEGLENSSFEYNIFATESLAISESNTDVASLADISGVDAVGIAESVSAVTTLADISAGDDITITEDTSVGTPA